jgi:hypothetical protein
MTLVTANDKYELIKAPKTGRYYNARTEHTAWYSQGALMPPEYKLIDDQVSPDVVDPDAERLAELVAAETAERERVEQELEKARKAAADREAERERVQKILDEHDAKPKVEEVAAADRDQLEQELQEARETIAALQAAQAGNDEGGAPSDPPSESPASEKDPQTPETPANPAPAAPTGGTPRSRRKGRGADRS